MSSKLYTGRLSNSDAAFLVLANDEIDAGRYVTARLGEPAEIREVPSDGVCLTLRPQLGEWASDRVAPNLALERALNEEPPAPPA